MDLTFPWPVTQGEWLAWTCAVITVAFGLLALFAPVTTMRMLRLQTRPDKPEAVSEIRASMAGFYLGLGLASILLAQPLVYLALGLSWGFTAFGRFISMMSDRGNTPYNWLSVVFDIILAAMPLVFVFGLVP